MKKFLATALVVILIGSMFSACGKKPAVDTKDNTSSETVAPAASSEAQGTTEVSDTPSWKKDTSPVELEWFIAYDWADLNFDPTNNAFDKYVLDNTGVTIKYTIGSQEKLNVLIATDSLPDIITYDAYSIERKNMEDNEMLMPLDELKAKYAPDIQASDGMVKWYTNEKDNHWYSWVSYFYDLQDTYDKGVVIETLNMNFARQDIMKQLNIDPASMNTKEGFIAALQKVKDAGITYNGQKVVPYMGIDVNYLAEQFGIDREDKDGNLMNEKRQPEYLEAILFLNEIYNKGLTTDEIFTMDNTTRKKLISSGGVFAGTSQAYLAGYDTLYYADNNALMEAIGLIKGNGGKEAIISPSPTAGWTATMISKNCKNPERAAALLAFMTQPEVSYSYYLGGIGNCDIVDGKAVINPEREKERSEDPSTYNAKYCSSIQDFMCDYLWVEMYRPTTNQDAYEQNKKDFSNKWAKGHIFDDKIFTSVTPESGTDLAAVNVQLSEYWNQQFPLMVMASTVQEATQIYNDTIAQMDSMGMKDLDTYQNERFHANKEKMGVTFAWPRNNQ
jgi:putative aldouronate transport system substrate-binding protein